jgi:NitT/TauT family transport system permease protein
MKRRIRLLYGERGSWPIRNMATTTTDKTEREKRKDERAKAYLRLKEKIVSIRNVRRIGGIAIFLAVWEVLSQTGVINVPSPSEVIVASASYVITERYIMAVLNSMARVASGFIIAVGVGVPLGLFMGMKIAFKDWTFPTFEILRPVPPIAWIPLAVIILPTVESSVIFLIFIGAFFPVVINTMLGVITIPEHVKRAAGSLGASGRDNFRQVVLPGAMPAIITGMTIGMGLTWDMLVAAEMVAGGAGLGYDLWYSYILIQYERVILFMITVGAAGYLFSSIVRRFGARYMRWRQIV